MAAETNPYIEKAYERLIHISEDEEKRLEYEAREKAIRDHNYLMKVNLERGRKEGVKAFIELCQEISFSREETSARLIEKFSLSSMEAKEYLERYWKE